jgi:hypothetical protein
MHGEPISIPLDLEEPIRAGWRPRDEFRQARLDPFRHRVEWKVRLGRVAWPTASSAQRGIIILKERRTEIRRRKVFGMRPLLHPNH